MNYSTLLMTISIPDISWTPAIGIIMVVANILAIAFGKLTMRDYTHGPALPNAALFGGFGLPAALATTAFGHILGIGAITGLHNLGIL